MCAGFHTPVYSHAGRGHFQDVYEPAEDSFLLMDALEKDAQRLHDIRSDARFPATHPEMTPDPHTRRLSLRCLQPGCVRGGRQRLRSGVCVPGVCGRTFSFVHVSHSSHLQWNTLVHWHRLILSVSLSQVH